MNFRIMKTSPWGQIQEYVIVSVHNKRTYVTVKCNEILTVSYTLHIRNIHKEIHMYLSVLLHLH